MAKGQATSMHKVDKILRKNGWYLERYSGDHRIYKNTQGQHMSIPPSLNKMMLKRFFKEFNIKE